MRRRVLAVLTAVSLALCLAFMGLRVRSADTTDVVMLATPGGHCLLLTSHEGKWLQVTGLSQWPDSGLAHWSASRSAAFLRRSQSWREAGPFLFWQRHSSSVSAGVWYVHGTVAVPADDGGKLPAYGDGYVRADVANGWAGVAPGDPRWLFLNGQEVRFPHTYVIGATSLLPLVVIPVWMTRQVRRLRRPKKGLCAGCGYDLRASTDRCPECGRPVAARGAGAIAIAPAPAPAVSGTAPAATAP
jgi:hypothetical protein